MVTTANLPAVLVTAYNRPSKLRSLFRSLTTSAPPLIFLHVDGPKAGDTEDSRLVEQTRDLVKELDWKPEVKTMFQDSNLGCREGMHHALDWFFDHVDEGIVLEDDLIVSPSMFQFFEHGLTAFAHPEIWMLSANKNSNFRSYRHPALTKVVGIWGWATWAHKWKLHDKGLEFWPDFRESRGFREIFPSKQVSVNFRNEIDQSFSHQIDTWDSGFMATIWKNGGFSISPPVNLASNLGFDAQATHTKTANFESNLPIYEPATDSMVRAPKPSRLADRIEFWMLKGPRSTRKAFRRANSGVDIASPLLSRSEVIPWVGLRKCGLVASPL